MTRRAVCLAASLLLALSVGCNRQEDAADKAGSGKVSPEKPASANGSSRTDAQPEDPSPEPERSEPVSAEQLVQRVGDFYGGIETLRVESQLTNAVSFQGQENTSTASRTIAFERPNRIAIQGDGDFSGTIISDGTNLVTFYPGLQKYTVEEAPDSLQNWAGPAQTGDIFLSSLLADDPAAKLMEGVKSSAYEGSEALNGNKVHHLKFVQEQFTWHMWVAAEGNPLVYQLRMDMTQSGFGGNADGEMQLTMTYTERFTGWQIDEPLDPQTFVFVAPDDAEQVEAADLFEAPGGSQPDPLELIGKQAPPVQLDLLEGDKQLQLADHTGKEIVLLDFWATWCPPCREEMPILEEIAADYKDKGVALYSVNLRETPEQVRQFLETEELDVTVALDKTGQTANDYLVSGIPTLVIIGKDGTVQSVHVGYTPAGTLQAELDDLLAGKNLAEAKLREMAATRDGAADAPAEEDESGSGNVVTDVLRALGSGLKRLAPDSESTTPVQAGDDAANDDPDPEQ